MDDVCFDETTTTCNHVEESLSNKEEKTPTKSRWESFDISSEDKLSKYSPCVSIY
jgi:hypothetical protein